MVRITIATFLRHIINRLNFATSSDSGTKQALKIYIMSDVKTFMFPDSGTRSGGLDPNALLAMSAEVESMRRASQSILDSMEHNQQVVGRCGEFLALINPQIAKEREQERLPWQQHL